MDPQATAPDAEDVSELVDGHLGVIALEALATDRADLLEAESRAHLASCAECSARLAEARRDLVLVDEALASPLSEAELDALVAGALTASAPRASRQALAWAAVLGGLAALVFGVLSFEGPSSAVSAVSTVSQAWTFAGLCRRMVDGLMPGGWPGLALVLSALLVVLAAPLRALLGGPRLDLRVTASALVLLSGLVAVPHAHALDFEGTWPVGERITLVVDDVPASIALERAAEAAGLGFVGVLSSDPVVHVRVRGGSLRDVVTAVLGADAAMVAERTPTLLVVRARSATALGPAETAVAEEPSVPDSSEPGLANVPSVPPVPPAVPSPPMVPTPHVSLGTGSPGNGGAQSGGRERVSFGGDVVVRSGEVVDSVFAMGGDATIHGEVLQDAVAMGGNVEVEEGGNVHGDAAAMGGSVHVARGGVVRGETVAMGGEVVVEEGGEGGDAAVLGAVVSPDDESEQSSLATWIGDVFDSAARHTLLFLFGLLLLGFVPGRLDLVQRGVLGQAGRAALAGILGALAGLVLAIVLVITIVGIPGAILLGLAAALAVYAGLVAVAAVIGRALPIARLEGAPVLQLGAGVAALFVASLVPWFGGIAVFVAGVIGFGAVILTRAGSRPASTAT